jgi:colanic acid/amylovoran biosynthesis glycosyltransferase
VNRRLGYLFARFPVFTQTFCVREVAELYRQGFMPPVFSILRPADERPLSIPLDHIPIYYLPNTNSFAFKLRAALTASPHLRKLWSGSGDRRDRGRFREAVHLGPKLREAGISHLHVHFASLAARTAWWLKRLYGITYSFTGHANDIFCPKPNQRVTLGDIITDASLIITASDYSANLLRRDYPEANTKIFRIYNGLDLSIFPPAIPKVNPLKLLSVGRLIEKKGFPFLIEACALLRSSGVNFECLIAGAGPERDRLENLIQVNHLSNQIRLLGAMSQAEISELLARSSLFVFPGIHDSSGDMDNLPTVIIEAMASGLPIVATEIGGIPEIVQHERNGTIVPEKDSVRLAQAIAVLGSNQALLEQYGVASREIVLRKFSLSDTVAELKSLLIRCLG